MKLDTVIVAEAAAQAGGKLSILGTWITRFNPPSFPWREPVTVVVRVFIEPEDFQHDHVVNISFVGDSISDVSVGNFEVTGENLRASIDQPPSEFEEHAVAFTATLHTLEIVKPGPFDVVVTIDGEVVRKYPIVVYGDAPEANVAE